jgi:tetratricopeptide (TPR) repeat protein
LKSAPGFAAIWSLLLCPLLYLPFCSTLCAQSRSTPAQSATARSSFGRTVVVIPFDNLSATTGFEWLSESFSETLHEQLDSPILYVASREERLRGYDRQGILAGIHPARAALYRLAEQMDFDFVIFGTYRYNNERSSLACTAQVLDMRAKKLFPAVSEHGPLADLLNLQSALAWDLLRLIRTDFPIPKENYISSVAPISLDAMKSYVAGVLAPSAEEKVSAYREAARLNPGFSRAWLELGEALYTQHTYEAASAALLHVPDSSPLSLEAHFYLGLAAYSRGDLVKSEDAFQFVADRLPLAEVYNNLGVVAARRGQKQSADLFSRAIQNDPSDADYHFNLAISLLQSGDRNAGVRELHTALSYRPADTDAKMLIESFKAGPGSALPAASSPKLSSHRMKHNYEEDAFRQVNAQMEGWAEQRFSHAEARAHARFHIALGKELLAHGFGSEAEEQFKHAATLDPLSPAPLIALAEDYEARGDGTGSRNQLEAALRLRESVDAYLLLVRLDLKENRTEAAEKDMNRLLQMEPLNSVAQDLRRNLAAKLAEKAQPLPQP